MSARGKWGANLPRAVLVLLRHKRRTVAPLSFRRAQQGQRRRVLARAMAMRSRRVAMESGLCRWVRIGRTSGFVTFGKGRLFEARSGRRSRGGNGLPFADQEAVGRNAKRGVMMKAPPASAFVMSKAKLLLEVLVVAFDPPAKFDDIDKRFKGQAGVER